MASVLDSGAGPGPCGPEDRLHADPSVGFLPRSAEIEGRQARLCSVFGLPAQAPLPAVTEASLVRYYRYLAARLEMPFLARHAPEGDADDRTVRVVALLDPREWDGGEHAGLLCATEPADGGRNPPQSPRETRISLFELEVPHGHPNYLLLEDYWFWFWNWRNKAQGHWA